MVSDDTALYARVRTELDGLSDRLWRVSTELHANPELAYGEHRAAALLTGELAADDFDLDRGVAGLDTAFVGRTGTAGAGRVALLMEYDALPEIGHACGHNLIAAAGLGAALALRRALPDLPGSLLAVGCPTEERGGGKVALVEAGVFDGVDAALMVHPASVTRTLVPLTAYTELRVVMTGRAAHPTGNPEEGISALDALVTAYTSLRELNPLLPEGSDIHGIITDGGAAVNVIPAHAEGRFGLRAATAAALAELKDTVTAHAEAAARAVGATARIETVGSSYAHFRNSDALSDVFAGHLARAGMTAAPPNPGVFLGSSDIGTVSTRVPAIHPLVAIADEGLSDHTPEFATAAASPRARVAMLAAAEALACTAADLLRRPELRDRAWERFAAVAEAEKLARANR